MTTTSPRPPAGPAAGVLLQAVHRELAADRIVTDPDVLQALSNDEAEWAPAGTPALAVRARTEAEVAAVVRIAADLATPIVPRGAGTGLSGGANAVDGCVILDLSKMTAIRDIDTENLTCTVEPGVVNNDLKAAVAAEGLWYPPDPASAPWSTIGGNTATNAGGLCCLKYGVTRDYVLGLRAVVGGPAGYGTVARLGRRTAKGVAGYDIAGLMVGSEGTLGVITEVTLRLRPAVTGVPRTVVGAFGHLVDAGRAVALVTRLGLAPSALELLDRTCLTAVENWKHLGIEADAAVLLLARVDTPGDAGDAEATALAQAFDRAGALWAERSTDDVEAEALFDARRLAYPALERLGPVLTEDICVPRSRLPDMLAAIERIGREQRVRIATIAHAGDGNLHPLMLAEPGDDQARLRTQQAFEDMIDTAIGLGGTVTAEHGVGLLKRRGLVAELDPASLTLQRAIKDTLDPLNLFNPGKVL